MLKALAREEKKTQALLRARAESQKRVRIPKVDVVANPFAETRQYNDLVQQMAANRNPALARRRVVSRFHSSPLFEEMYPTEGPKDWDQVDETAVGLGVSRERLIHTLSKARATRPVVGQAVLNRSYFLIDPETGRPMVEQDRTRERQPEAKKPPSFGHRPSSASRHLDPLRQTVQHERAAPERRTVGMSPADLRQLLHDEATLASEVKPPSPKDHVMDVDPDLYTTRPAPPERGGPEVKPEESLAALKDDIEKGFKAGGLVVDKRARRRRLRAAERRRRNEQLEKAWDTRTQVGAFSKHKGVKHDPPSESLREQLQKFRAAAAGVLPFPFAEERHQLDSLLAKPENKYLIEAGTGRLPASLEKTRRGLSSTKPATPRSERQNREVQRIIKARKARDKRNEMRVRAHETRKQWDTIPKVPSVASL